MSLKESGEMYLETIYRLCREKGEVRAIDVAESMQYSKPSVSRAIGLLRNEGYVTLNSDGYIILTDTGRSLAEKIFERHTVLSEILMALGVDEETAAADACRIEHVISDSAFAAIKAHLHGHGGQ